MGLWPIKGSSRRTAPSGGVLLQTHDTGTVFAFIYLTPDRVVFARIIDPNVSELGLVLSFGLS